MSAGSLAACVLAHAQGGTVSFPVKPIRLVVPLATGGGTDITARVLAQKLGELVGQSVVVDNRPGASGVLGTELVARSPADGYTLLLASNSFASNPSLFRKLPYDPLKDFAPVSLLAVVPYVLTTHPSLPAGSVKDFIAFAAARPRELNHASSGSGTGPHLAMEVFMQLAGLKLVHIPYKGAGAAMNDLIAGHVHVFMAGLLTALPHIKSARIRALGVSRAARASAAPHIPTLSEAGVPGLNEGGQYGIVVPVQVDGTIILKLRQDIVAAMRQPAVIERMRTEGAEVVVSTPREYAEVLANDVRKWSRVIRAAGIPQQ